MRFDQHDRCAIALLTAVWMLSACTGCSDHNELKSPPAIPQVLESDDRQWAREGEVASDDSAVLDAYFRKHMAEIDNPIFEEPAVAYSDGNGARRYYWFTMTASGTSWLFLEFDRRGRFHQSGEGAIPKPTSEIPKPPSDE